MTTPAKADGSALRRDAARNRDKVLAAARAAFDECGVDVGVEVIAHRAGVGMGTLYRRFPTKELLIDAVVDGLLADVLSVAQAALEHSSAADGLADFLRAVGRLQVEHAGCVNRLWSGGHDQLRDRIELAVRDLLGRGQTDGAVRADLVYEDVVVLIWALRGVIETTSAVAPEAWLRHLDLVLAALAPGGPPLGHPPLSGTQVNRVRSEVARRAQHGPWPDGVPAAPGRAGV